MRLALPPAAFFNFRPWGGGDHLDLMPTYKIAYLERSPGTSVCVLDVRYHVIHYFAGPVLQVLKLWGKEEVSRPAKPVWHTSKGGRVEKHPMAFLQKPHSV